MEDIFVYDLDDTLYCQKTFVHSGFKAVSTWLEHTHFIGGFLPLVKELYEEGKRKNIFNLALETMGLSFDATWIEQMVNIYRTHTPNIALFEDTRALLKEMQGNYPQAIITDGHVPTQQNKVKTLGVDKLMDFIYYSDTLGEAFRKPSPLPYQKVMEHFGKGKHYYYIGDNPNKDFITAKKLGWSTVRIQRPDGEFARLKLTKKYEAQVTLTSFSDLSYYFSSLLASSTYRP